MRLSVYLPDELAATVRLDLPDLNVSGLLQAALQAALACEHPDLVCACCARPVDHRRLRDAALNAMYVDALWQLRDLVERGGTAEGAARILKDVAERHQVPAAGRAPLPRPSRAQRHANTVKELPSEPSTRRSA